MFNIRPLYEAVSSRISGPVAVILGAPRLAADLAESLPADQPIDCFQLDTHQAERLRSELAERNLAHVSVKVHADLWDMGDQYTTAVFPVAAHGERELKLDMVEQSYQILAADGWLVSLSEYPKDQLLPKAHKAIYGKCGELPASKLGSAFWSKRGGPKPRRRHAVTFHARFGGYASRAFESWPGTFSYGSLDDGARALLDAARLQEGDHVLDLGCGPGANGILATDAIGAEGRVTFIDSSARAAALAEINAKANGLTNYRCLANADVAGVEPETIDVVLANPPYYAQSNIARMFIEKSLPLLKSGGRFHFVTKMPNELGPTMVEFFPDSEYHEHRGYTVFSGIKGGAPAESEA